MTKPTDVSTFIADCDGGVFDNQISKILSEAAMSAVTHGRQADVTIKISMKQIDKSQQVSVKHKLSYSMPTIRGKVTEDSEASTPFYVCQGGRLSLFLDSQSDLFSAEKTKENA